ncbi:hypothetical protein AAZX31_17G223000 [Glycine max]
MYGASNGLVRRNWWDRMVAYGCMFSASKLIRQF